MTRLTLRADRALIRTGGESVRYLLASITADTAPRRTTRMPVNVAFVLDRSGSMAGESKLRLAKEAVKQSLLLLGPEDRFSIVMFDDVVDVLMPSTFASAEAKRSARHALGGVNPRSSTDLCSGWMHGCDQLAHHLSDDTISRVLLLTDGQANHGEQDPATLARHAGELRRRGIATSAFGVGADFDERLLRDIATEGGGNFYFIQHAAQIPDLITSELGEALEVVVRGATLRLSLPAGARAEVLNRFRSRRADGRTSLHIELGDLVSNQELDVSIRVTFPLGAAGESPTIEASVGDTLARVAFTYASHEENDVQPRDRAVDREVARVYAGRARAEATEGNRHGDFERARRVLTDTARHIDEYAGDDAELVEISRLLCEEVPQFAERVMEPMMLKRAFHVAESAVRGRDHEGKAKRGGSR